MLDFKWGYRDGQIAAWTATDLEALLLDHYPRKVLLPDEEILRVVPAALDFLTYLRDRGLLSGDPLPELPARLQALLPDFAAAMVDRRRFGLAKTIGSLMRADGVDVTEEDAVQGWLAAFNAKAPDERDALLGEEEDDALSEPLVLPAVELASRAELEAAARDAAPVARLVAFTRYVGEGKRLTAKGNLTVADARALVPLLGTRDLVDPVIGGQRFQTRSAADLPGLGLVFRWARAAGFVKVRSGRVSATARGRRLGRDPLEDWGAAFEGYFRADPLGIRSAGFTPFWDPLLAELIDQLPLLLYLAEKPIEVGHLADDVWFSIEEGYDLDALGLDREVLWGSIDRYVDALVIAPFVELGAVRVEDGRVSLTELGRWGANRVLRRRGHLAPIVGEYALAPVEELLRASAELLRADAERELKTWIERHPWTAARDLAEAVRSTPFTALAIRGLELIGRAAEPEVRALLDDADPTVAAYARIWLVDQNLEPPESIPPEVLMATLVEQFGRHLDAAGPLATVAEIAAMDPDEAGQLHLVEGLGSARHPRAGELLGVIARYHPSAQVREAAGRRAAKARGSALH